MSTDPTVHPHRKIFIAVVIAMVVIGLALIGKYGWRIHEEAQVKDEILATPVADILEFDSNTNGIPDWQEALWGLDPKGNGDKNKTFIETKKKELGIAETPSATSTPPLNETERFSREFFAVIMSLRQSGTLDQDAISAIAKSLATNLSQITKTQYQAKYTLADIKTSSASDNAALSKYEKTLRALVNKYNDRGIGIEMKSVSDALTYNDERPLLGLELVQKAYADFSKELLKMTVPKVIAPTQLELVNESDIISRTLVPMTHILENPVDAMPAIAVYQKQIDIFVATINRLNAFYNKS